MNALRNWWKNHRTKTLGLLVTVFGAVQTYLPQVQAMLKEHYGLVFAAIGVLTTVLGFLNSQQNSQQ